MNLYSYGIVVAFLISIMNIPIVLAVDTFNKTAHYEANKAWDNQTAYYCWAIENGKNPPENNTIMLLIEAGAIKASEQKQYCDWLIHGDHFVDKAK